MTATRRSRRAPGGSGGWMGRPRSADRSRYRGRVRPSRTRERRLSLHPSLTRPARTDTARHTTAFFAPREVPMTATVPMGVLLVDPDPGERFRIKSGLEAFGWHVWDAPDGPTAVRTYADRRDAIRVVVVDLQLPGLQGSRVLAELGQLDPALPRCAMSADVPPYAAAAFRR